MVALAGGCSSTPSSESLQTGDLPLRQVAQVQLTGGPVRFDYTSLDAGRGLLFLAHMGAGEIIEVDVHTHQVVRTLADVPDVHGVLVVPDEHRVYATATGRNQLVAFDEDTGDVVFTAPTGKYPDGLAYDPVRHTVWTTNELRGRRPRLETGTAGDQGDAGVLDPGNQLDRGPGDHLEGALEAGMLVTHLPGGVFERRRRRRSNDSTPRSPPGCSVTITPWRHGHPRPAGRVGCRRRQGYCPISRGRPHPESGGAVRRGRLSSVAGGAAIATAPAGG
ncbi:hypothetical protein LZP97_26690 (plasmid) [Rhodococcus sp. DMF-1]|nr:hypothetical protein [Rhodococcus sp. DMF-1]UIR39727.1 hypothetical protein LZP97_26690 [Rhodococcus sp. DMF-1]